MSNAAFYHQAMENKRLRDEKEARRREFIDECTPRLKEVLELTSIDVNRMNKKDKIKYSEMIQNQNLENFF